MKKGQSRINDGQKLFQPSTFQKKLQRNFRKPSQIPNNNKYRTKPPFTGKQHGLEGCPHKQKWPTGRKLPTAAGRVLSPRPLVPLLLGEPAVVRSGGVLMPRAAGVASVFGVPPLAGIQRQVRRLVEVRP